jgi:sarcosine oxidase subunit delta
MSFMLECPNCGKRHVGEFSYRGGYTPRPAPDAPPGQWTDYVDFSDNVAGRRTEWWYHGSGCQRWFLVDRNASNNTDHRSRWFAPRGARDESR